MKRLLTIIAVLALSLNISYAQTPDFTEGFDSLTVGSGVAAQLGGYFTTWSYTTGGSEDPKVSDVQYLSAGNSMYVSAGNDGVIHFMDLTSGRYQIDFQLFVDNGKVAYLNLLQDFNGSNSEWGMQAFFYTNGTGSVDANAEASGIFTYPQGQWFPISFIVDIDDDYATMYINGAEVISWVWSKGSYGNGTLNKLDAINFYAWADPNAVASSYYVDDFSFTNITSPEAPTNLATVVSVNDIAVSWDAPANSTPDAYAVFRNDFLVDNTITATSFSENDMYPNTYNYVVRAKYNNGQGYSHASNIAVAEIAGGVDRNLVLLEINTGTWCGFCPGAAMGADDLIHNEHEVAVIEYHNGDDYVNADATAREVYYTVTGFPTSTFDGQAGFSGGNATQSLYDSYVPYYNARIDYTSVINLDLDVTENETDEYTVSIDVTETNPYFDNGLVLRVALTESHIPEVWGGLSEVNFVCQKMYPDAAGTALDFSATSTLSNQFLVSTAGMDVLNCEVVVFIQHEPTKEVIQTAKFSLASLISVTEEQPTHFNIYPNPSHGVFNLDIMSGKSQSFDIEVMDVRGKTIKSLRTNNSNLISKQIDLTHLSKGVYFVRITGDDNSVMKQIQIK